MRLALHGPRQRENARPGNDLHRRARIYVPGELGIPHEDTLVVTVASGVERTGWEQTVFLSNRSSLLGREWSF